MTRAGSLYECAMYPSWCSQAAYDPDGIAIRAGDTVVWANRGALPHTVTDRSESFDSGFLMAGDTWGMQFDQPGLIEYFCTVHPEMVGTITVLAADDLAPAGATGPADASSGEGGAVAAPGRVAAGVSGATEASVAVILLLVFAVVGFIVYVVHSADGDADTGARPL